MASEIGEASKDLASATKNLLEGLLSKERALVSQDAEAIEYFSYHTRNAERGLAEALEAYAEAICSNVKL